MYSHSPTPIHPLCRAICSVSTPNHSSRYSFRFQHETRSVLRRLELWERKGFLAWLEWNVWLSTLLWDFSPHTTGRSAKCCFYWFSSSHFSGCKIKALRAKTNTYIKTPVRGEEPVFVVTGRKEDVAKAKREILSAAEHFSLIRASRKPSLLGGLTGKGTPPGPPSNVPGQVTILVRVPYRVGESKKAFCYQLVLTVLWTQFQLASSWVPKERP